MRALLDTNIFIIDRFFTRDPRHPVNKQFLNLCSKKSFYFSIYSLFELTGIASFNLSEKELKKWFYDFEDVYNIAVLGPKLYDFAKVWFDNFSEDLFAQIQKKATFGDALILKEAKDHKMDCIVTWNKKDFLGRSNQNQRIITPEEFVDLQI